MLSDLQTWTVIGLAALLWLPISLVGAINGGPGVALALSDLISMLLIAMSAFERWGWRWRWLHPHLIGRPVAYGTWRGTLQSLWKDPATRQPPPAKIVYLAIRQTLTTVWVRLLTDESVSDQMAGSVEKDPSSGDWSISYTYRNTPKLPLRRKSPQHRGGAFLTILGQPPTRIEGEYWTDRDSKGTLAMDARMPTIAHSFAEAQALFAEASNPA